MEVLFGILIPFIGTALGSACVFFMKKSLGDLVQRALAGFAAGVMVAASIWSLLIPAIEQSDGMGKLSFLPAFIGFWVGVLFAPARPSDSSPSYRKRQGGGTEKQARAYHDDGACGDLT